MPVWKAYIYHPHITFLVSTAIILRCNAVPSALLWLLRMCSGVPLWWTVWCAYLFYVPFWFLSNPRVDSCASRASSPVLDRVVFLSSSEFLPFGSYDGLASWAGLWMARLWVTCRISAVGVSRPSPPGAVAGIIPVGTGVGISSYMDPLLSRSVVLISLFSSSKLIR